jgi:hypothetical protein
MAVARLRLANSNIEKVFSAGLHDAKIEELLETVFSVQPFRGYITRSRYDFESLLGRVIVA